MAAGREPARRRLRQRLREGHVGVVERVLPAAVHPHRQAAQLAGVRVHVAARVVGGAVEGIADAVLVGAPQGGAHAADRGEVLRVQLRRPQRPVPAHGPAHDRQRPAEAEVVAQERDELVEEHRHGVIARRARVPVRVAGLHRDDGEGRDAALLDAVGHVVTEAQPALEQRLGRPAAAGQADEDGRLAQVADLPARRRRLREGDLVGGRLRQVPRRQRAPLVRDRVGRRRGPGLAVGARGAVPVVAHGPGAPADDAGHGRPGREHAASDEELTARDPRLRGRTRGLRRRSGGARRHRSAAAGRAEGGAAATEP